MFEIFTKTFIMYLVIGRKMTSKISLYFDWALTIEE